MRKLLRCSYALMALLMLNCSGDRPPVLLVRGIPWGVIADPPEAPGDLLATAPPSLGYKAESSDAVLITEIMRRAEASRPLMKFEFPAHTDVRIDCLLMAEGRRDTLSFSVSGVMYWRGKWRVLDWCVLSRVLDLVPAEEAAVVRNISEWWVIGTPLK